MRILVNFTSDRPVSLPVAYNSVIQGLIYSHIAPEAADFLHNRGFNKEKRSFRLFSFSRLMGKAVVTDGNLYLKPPFSLIITSLLDDFLHELATNLQRKGRVNIGKTGVQVESLFFEECREFSSGAEIKMLSPMTIYSTLTGPDGKNKTYYYAPFEQDFSEMLKRNLVNKFEAAYGVVPVDDSFLLEPLKLDRRNEKVMTYKGFVIKGWMGSYRITGSTEMLKLAYEAGLGGKNAQGFGCFEVID